MKYYTLQYVNDCGDTVARDYFDNEKEAIEFMDGLIATYKECGADTGLILEDSNGKLIADYESEIDYEEEYYDEDYDYGE